VARCPSLKSIFPRNGNEEAHMTRKPAVLLVALGLCLPMMAAAVPTITGVQAYTENVGPNPLLPSGWRLMVGATSITPSGAGTAVQAVHASDPTWNYAAPASASPLYPDAYFASVPYTGQTGMWQLQATDGTGTGGAGTHALSDARELPLLTGLSASGPLLTPTFNWNRIDPATYPSGCVPPACVVGFDFFNYGLIVRNAGGALIYQSAVVPNVLATPTSWALPPGVLAENQQYLIGFRLNMSELELINPNGSFVSPLENRSTAYLVYTTVVPEPSPAALLLAGLLVVGWLGRPRTRRA
jgi:hypothetical protein